MQIFTISLTGLNLLLEVEPSNIVQDVKVMIQEMAGFPLDQHCLVFGRKLLENGRTLADYSIQDKDTIHVVLRTGGPWYIRYPLMTIFVKTLTGKIITARLRCFNTVDDLKIMIQEMEEYPYYQQRLIFDYTLLNDDRTLSDYNVQDKNTLLLMLQMEEACNECNPKMIISVQALTGITTRLQVRRFNTIENVKSMIREKEGIPLNQQRLIFNDRILENNLTLAYYSIEDKSIIKLLLNLGGPCGVCSPILQIFVQILAGSTIALQVQGFYTIKCVKIMIQERENISPNQQLLIFDLKQLENDRELSDYNIQDKDTVYLAL